MAPEPDHGFDEQEEVKIDTLKPVPLYPEAS